VDGEDKVRSQRRQPAPAHALVLPPCSPALKPLVASLSLVAVGAAVAPRAALERILPAGRIHLMVNLHEDEFRTYDGPGLSNVRRTRGAVLEGPHSRPRVIDTRFRWLVAVDFRFGGASSLFRPPLSEVRDQLVDLEHLWGRDAAALRERLLEAPTPAAKLAFLEAALFDHLAGPREPDAAMRFAATTLERGASVSEVAARLGLLPKTFVRRFREQAGLAPKRYSRVRRLQCVLRLIGDPDTANWADLAAHHGYADQAHLIHDFRALTGMAPTACRARSPGEGNHVPVTPRAPIMPAAAAVAAEPVAPVAPAGG